MKVEYLKLKLDVTTRFNSLFLMLERILTMKKVL